MKSISASEDVYQTGYFARAGQNGLSAKSTKVHVIKNGKPVCGYKPHKTMQFCWNANGIYLSYVDCPKCKALCQPKPEPEMESKSSLHKLMKWITVPSSSTRNPYTLKTKGMSKEVKQVIEPLKSKTTIQDLLDVIHFTVIKNEKVNKKCLKEIQSIQDKIHSGKLQNYNVQTPMWWTCVFSDVKENGYEIKPKFN